MNARRAPDLIDLRRVWAWQACPFGGGPADRQAVAWHEAGHAVYARWIGWGMRRVELHDGGGNCFPAPIDLEGTAQPEDANGELRATAAGLFHAGLAAELLHAGLPWRGPIARPLQPDHQKAEIMLSLSFGARTLAGHAYAQLLALHVLSAHWGDVRRIATTLMETGAWTPEIPPARTDRAAPQGRHDDGGEGCT